MFKQHAWFGFIGILASSVPAGVNAQVTFHDIAANDGAGITYRRAPTPVSVALFDAIKAKPIYFRPTDLPNTPIKARGAPGVALFDYDRDGDQDIYVTNGPGAANSLYANQLVETGRVTFVDVAAVTHTTLTHQDSTGVCFGDIDNDGDHDLLVLGRSEPNILLENQGGSFTDISLPSGIGTTHYSSSSCSMGDIDQDGLLDIAIANSFDWTDQQPIFVVPYALNEPNELWRNQGSNTFTDVSVSSGFREVATVPDTPFGTNTLSWAVAMVDLDLDGDVDIVTADDQAALPTFAVGGIDRGLLQIYENDGTGTFMNVTLERDIPAGAWMGLSFGDFNRDGLLDMFATNFGNRTLGVVLNDPNIFQILNFASRYFLLQSPGGTFADGIDLQPDLHVPFGWGTGTADYDNDGDTDIITHGGLDQGLFILSSPAMVLANDGHGHFRRDQAAFAGSTDHTRRTVHGMALGDLDDNGFIDVVSVSNFDFPNAPVLQPPPIGGPFDGDAIYAENFVPIGNSATDYTFTGLQLPEDGTLSVELSSGGNGNRSVQVEVMGTVGMTTRGRVNRDGIGAVLTFTPKRGAPVMRPILGGSSHASQHSLRATLGLGTARSGTVEVVWPGGVRNRLYRVRAGSKVLLPEIPCSFDDPHVSFPQYFRCIRGALRELVHAGVIDRTQKRKLLFSGLIAYWDARK